MWRMHCLLLTLTIAVRAASAAEIAVAVRDQDGKPAADAVVSLWPADHRAAPPSNAAAHMIDQRNEAFVPFVTVMWRGDALSFKNSDRTRHHVYSFSPVKPFEMILNPGETSQALKFDQSGVVAIGCNIHDKMIAYAFVTDTPWTALTDAQGRASISSLPKGKYRAEVWHPRLDADARAPEQTLTLDADVQATFELRLNPAQAGGAHQRHY